MKRFLKNWLIFVGIMLCGCVIFIGCIGLAAILPLWAAIIGTTLIGAGTWTAMDYFCD